MPLKSESQHKQRMQNGVALLCCMSVVAFITFAAIDPLMNSGHLYTLFTVRAVLVAGGLCLLALAVRGSAFARPNVIGIAICLWTGGGVIVLTGLTGGSASAYWTMVMVTFFATSLILPIRPLPALLTFSVVALFYIFWMWWIDAMGSSEDWAVSNAGIWLSIFVSVLSVGFLDKMRRREDQDRINLNALNQQLHQEIRDREQAESTAKRAQQLEAVGQLAAGLAHEINNLLTIISISADAIHQEGKANPAFTQRIIDGAKQGGRLAQDMLVFARKNPKVITEFDINQSILDVMNLIGSYGKMGVQLRQDLTPEPLWVKGDQALIGQLLLNCCLNALDAMEHKGTLALASSLNPSDPPRVCIRITDTGCGMTPDEMRRAFEPFYTTKPPGKGTGLGLSVAYGTVQDHDGSIQLQSTKGEGTTVLIHLPRANAPKSALDVHTTRPQAAHGRVLVVDDDDMVRTVMCETLKTLGYVATTAENGEVALSILQEAPSAFDLVILDMVMPVMGGEETFYRMRRIVADLPVLVYSGYTKDEAISSMLHQTNVAFIAKPFTRERLNAALSEFSTRVTS